MTTWTESILESEIRIKLLQILETKASKFDDADREQVLTEQVAQLRAGVSVIKWVKGTHPAIWDGALSAERGQE